MTIKRLDNIGIVVEDLDAVLEFFGEVGLDLEGRTTVEGPSVDKLVALEGVRCDIAVVRTPDGHGRLELMRFHTPVATTAPNPATQVNDFGMRRVMFAVDDLEARVDRLRAKGYDLLGEVVRYGADDQLAYVRGPEGIIVALAENA